MEKRSPPPPISLPLSPERRLQHSVDEHLVVELPFSWYHNVLERYYDEPDDHNRRIQTSKLHSSRLARSCSVVKALGQLLYEMGPAPARQKRVALPARLPTCIPRRFASLSAQSNPRPGSLAHFFRLPRQLCHIGGLPSPNRVPMDLNVTVKEQEWRESTRANSARIGTKRCTRPTALKRGTLTGVRFRPNEGAWLMPRVTTCSFFPCLDILGLKFLFPRTHAQHIRLPLSGKFSLLALNLFR